LFSFEDAVAALDGFLQENKVALLVNQALCQYLEKNHPDLLLVSEPGFARLSDGCRHLINWYSEKNLGGRHQKTSEFWLVSGWFWLVLVGSCWFLGRLGW
jgi:hypothetical protein